MTMDLTQEPPVVIHVENSRRLPPKIQGLFFNLPEGTIVNNYRLVQACTEFILGRTFPRTRQNCREVLQCLELNYFNEINIVEKTHGLLYHDFFWVKLDPEDTTTYDDIKLRPE